jgi:hypothetical protein
MKVQPASHALEQSFVTKHYGFNINAVHIMVMALCIVKRSGNSSREPVLTVLVFRTAAGRGIACSVLFFVPVLQFKQTEKPPLTP